MKRLFTTVLALLSLSIAAPAHMSAPVATDDLVPVLQELRVVQLLEELTRRHRPRAAAFVDVTLVSVRDGALRQNQTVVVENGRFTAVGDAATTAVPAGAERIDGRGRYLLPGLADMHVHLMVSNSQKLLNLANGVTTFREMDGFPHLLAERRAIARGDLLAPNLYVAGTILNAVPMGIYARVVTSPEEARVAVREQKRDGYDFIKVHNFMPMEIYTAVLDEARRQKIDVVGHIPHQVKLEDAIRLGQRTLEHFKGYYYDTNLEMTTEDYVGLTKGADVWLCPTLYNRRGGLARKELEQLIATSDEMRYVPAADKRRWLEQAKDEPNWVNETIYQRSTKIFKDLLAIHARFLTGTDSGGGYNGHVPGFSLQHELEIMESLGMPPADVLRAATLNAAEAMRRESEFGAIEVGLRADCVLATKNPLETVANLRAPKGVMVRGVWLSPAAISDMLARLEAVYADDARLVGADPREALDSAARDFERLGRVPARVGREPAGDALAGLLLDAGRTAEAIAVARSTLAAFPASAPAFARLAEASAKRGDRAAARRHAERALDLDAGDARARRVFEGVAPAADPTGRYELETQMLVNGRMKAVRIALEVTGSTGRMTSDAAPDLALSQISAAGDRLWAAAAISDDLIELRLVVTGATIRGTWSAGFGRGRLTGTKTSHR
jgi:imidazolonepropionase-like amidohydrolase